jgi:hypothetical protein
MWNCDHLERCRCELYWLSSWILCSREYYVPDCYAKYIDCRPECCVPCSRLLCAWNGRSITMSGWGAFPVQTLFAHACCSITFLLDSMLRGQVQNTNHDFNVPCVKGLGRGWTRHALTYVIGWLFKRFLVNANAFGGFAVLANWPRYVSYVTYLGLGR